MIEQLSQSQHVVGTKQTLKALEQGTAVKIFMAKDADEEIKNKICDLCKLKGVSIEYVDTMNELGKTCNISLKAAVACIIN